MANSGFVKFKLTGLEEIRATLRQLPEETQRKVMAVAVRKAAKPMVAAAKTYALRSVRTGALRNSIDVVVKKSRSGDSYAIVGPARGYFVSGKRLKKGADARGADQPANYAHLVEFGHHSAAGTGVVLSKTRGKSRRKGTLNAVSFVRPKPFMRPAVLTTQEQVAANMAEGVAAGLAQALKRIVKNPAARG